MNKTDERTDQLIAPAVTLNLKELVDKGFMLILENVLGQQRMKVRSHIAGSVCSIT